MNQIPIFRIFGATELLSAEGQPVDDILRRPKRLALMSYLLLAAPGSYHRRDTILGLFWPELDQERARGALRQALYGISKSLGEGVVVRRGNGEVGIDTSRIWCDALEFERRLDNRQTAEALSLYKGDALPGLFVPGAGQELDQWLADLRERLRGLAVEAALGLARNLSATHDAHAAKWASWAASHSPDDEKVAREAMSLLAAVGDRAGALRTYEHFAARLRSEFESDPSSETRQVANAIRNGGLDEPVVAKKISVPIQLPQPASVITSPSIPTQLPKRWTRSTRPVLIAASLIIVALLVVGVAMGSDTGLSALRGHTVLVGPVLAPRGAGIDDLAEAIPAMLTEQLAYGDKVNVVDRQRALELHAQRHVSPDSVLGAHLIARDANADVVITGSVNTRGPHDYELTLRAESALDDNVIAETKVSGTNAGQLVDNAIAELLPKNRKALSDTGTIRAWRLYEDGLRAFAAGESRSASGLLAEAFTLDTAHALAALYLSSALDQVGASPSPDILRKAVQLAGNSSPVDGMRIRVRWAEVSNDPLFGQLADSLVALAPNDPQALIAAGLWRISSGDFLGAIPRLRRAVQLDSTSRGIRTAVCLACRALGMMSAAYSYADSVEAATRVFRELVQWQPDNPDNWQSLSVALARLGYLVEARVARDRALQLRPRDSATIDILDALTAVNLENYATADQMLEHALAAPHATRDEKATALWWLTISRRQQGRYHEALASLEQMRHANGGVMNAGMMLHMGQIYGELGDWQHARVMFDSAARLPGAGADLSSSYGRHRAWTLTHVARARAARGDTVGLMALADSVRNLGEMSAFGRDWKLHHFIRAQVLELRGDTASAIAEYQKSIFSRTLGFTCANYRLGKLLVAQHRPREAIAIVRSALHGGRDASNTYVTATELHEVMASAFEMIGERDSAAAHYSAVAKAWRGAEPRWRVLASRSAARAVQLRGEPRRSGANAMDE